MNTQYFLNKLIQKQDLTTNESQLLLTEMMRGNFNQIQTSSILTALAMKCETVDEIVGFIKTLREQMVHVHADDAIDVCGTGGDSKGTFNISTAVAFVVSGAGVKVAKHGNRAASSHCGSADVLEQLGVNINISTQQAETILQRVGMVFLFAPLFHPAMKQVSSVRKELQIRTVFNFLGPFANPFGVRRQLIGVPNMSISEKLAQVARQLDYEHLLIVTSEDGMDEISISRKTYAYEIKHDTVSRFIIDPKDYYVGNGFKPFLNSTENPLQGGNAKTNAAIIKNIVSEKKGPQRDMVVFNSAFALYVSGKINNIHEGITLAENSIDSGAAKNVLENLVKETQRYA